MSTIINGTSNAITFPDSTIQNTAALPLTGGTVAGNLSVTGNLSFNSGYGSSAVAYGCRAWVNFDGTGTPSIRASGNVSSITDLGAGAYRTNFTTAMPDANYSATGSCGELSYGGILYVTSTASFNAGYFEFLTFPNSVPAGSADASHICVAIFR
jgi:hypothetical protein